MYKHFGKVMLRVPLISFQELLKDSNEDRFNFNLLIERKLNDPIFMEALYWASPDFYKWIELLKEDKINDKKKIKRILHTFRKYIIRAASRCTPYGIFAGCTILPITKSQTYKTDIELVGTSKRRVRVDMGLLNEIVKGIIKNPNIWSSLRYLPNNSLYQIQETYRYMEYELREGRRHYQLSSIECTEVLDEIIYQAKIEALTVTQIYDLIGSDISEIEKSEFVRELIQMQFLVSELEIEVTNESPVECLADQLKSLQPKCHAIIPYIDLIEELVCVTELFEKKPLGVIPFQCIRSLENKIRDLDISLTESIFFQADLLHRNSFDLKIDEKLLKEIWKGVEVFSKFTPYTSPQEEQLKQFKKSFLERYDTQEIPLAEVLDAEMGLGFPVLSSIGNIAYNDFATELKMSNVKNQKNIERCSWHAYLQQEYDRMLLSNEKILFLQDKDLTSLESKVSELADTITVMCSLLPNGQVALLNVGGSTANNLLGRFAYLNEDFNKLCLAVSEKEDASNEGFIVAEIVHLPEGRVGNVVRRTRLRTYEIPYLGISSQPHEYQIPIEDLMVSVQYDELVLRSKKLNKRVIPRLSSAHNYAASELPVYQFLCAVQHQGKPGLHFSWGDWAEGRKFLPRVCYNNIVLQRGSWLFDLKDYRKLLEHGDKVIYALREFFAIWSLPRYVLLSDGDNELFIDLEEEEYLFLLWEEWIKKKNIKLVEALCDESKTQDYVNQVIIPFYKDEILRKTRKEFLHVSNEETVKRVFPPGSEWIYFKIYCGAFVSDRIITDVLGTVGESLVERKKIDQYFFVRYNDPHYHLRFRVHLTDTSIANYTEILSEIYDLLNPYISSRVIWKTQLDTYIRELERYGSDSMLLSEKLFFLDSRLILALLKKDNLIIDNKTRLFSGIKILDAWLDLYLLDTEDKIIFTEKMVDASSSEFGEEVKTQLNRSYRRDRNELEEFLKANSDGVFSEKRLSIPEQCIQFNNLASYVHMSMNRWFNVDQRVMEYAAYVYANKYYISRQYASQI